MATILIVDDDQNIRTTLAAYIRGLGHTVETAGSGRDSLAVLERREVDVVLSDVRMAEVDGLTLLRTIRRRWPATRVAIMTAYATVRDAVDAMRDGADDYLAKPFGLEEVGALLPRLLSLGNPAGAGASLGGTPVAVDPMAPTGLLSLEELERRHIERVLRNTSSLDEAATSLGINASTLWRKRKRYRIG